MIQLLKYLTAFTLLTLPALCAPGDIIVREVQPDGWRIKLVVQGPNFNVGSTFTLNGGYTGEVLPTRSTKPTSAVPFLTVPTWGYTGTTKVQKTRKIYLGLPVRLPYNTRVIPGAFTSGTFTRNEQVTSTTGITGRFVGTTSTGPNLYITGLNGTPTGADVIWQGDASSAIFTPTGLGAFASPNPNPSGNFGVYDQRIDGSGNLVLEFPLSEYVYQRENTIGPPPADQNVGVAPTITIPSGFIISGANLSVGLTNQPLIATGGGDGQLSNQAYHIVKYWWMWPDKQIFGEAAYPRAFAWCPHGYGGKPGIECVQFRVSQGSTVVPGRVVSWLDKDHTMPKSEFTNKNGACVPTYIDSINLSGITPATVCSLDAKVYPQIGDTIYDTALNVLLPEAIYGTQTFVCDRANTYGRTFAVASPTGTDPAAFTDDLLKTKGNGLDPTVVTGTTDYLTIARAARAIRNFNAVRTPSRDDVGGGVVYLKAGNYQGFGKTIIGVNGGYGAIPATYISIEPYPGVARSAVAINSELGDDDLSDCIRAYNITISLAAGGLESPFSSINDLWFDQCEFNTPANNLWSGNSSSKVYLTHNKLTQLVQGIKGPAGTNMIVPLMRGNEFAGFAHSVHVHSVCAGNWQNSKYTSTSRFVNRLTGFSGPHANALLAFNSILGWSPNGGANAFALGNRPESDINGWVVLQNIFEQTENTSVSPGFVGDLGTQENSANYPMNNCAVEYSLFMGQRCAMAYNSEELVIKERYRWEIRHSYWETLGLKSDDFNGLPNGIRQGNWPMFFGTNMAGNVYSDTRVGGTGFGPYFIGLFGYDGSYEISVNDWTWPKFKDHKASLPGTSSTSGSGDYTLQPDSPMRDRQQYESFSMPFDMSGHRRRAIDACGPYSQNRQVGRNMF